MRCLAAVSEERATVYAGTTRGVFVSRDAGRTWTKAFGDADIAAIAVSPDGLRTVYAAGFGEKLIVGRDRGTQWQERQMPPELPHVTSLTVDRLGTLYAGTFGGALRSADGGESWTQINRGLGEASPPFFSTIAADSTWAGIVYGGTSEGIFRTTDGGDNWSPVSDFSATALRIDLAGTIYAATVRDGVVVSTDGIGWQRIEGGEPLPPNLNALAIDPFGHTIWTAEATNVFAWTAESGWVRSSIREQGLFGVHLESIFTEQGWTGLAATERGVFRQEVDGQWVASRQGLRGRHLLRVAIDPERGDVYASDYYSVIHGSAPPESWSEHRVPGTGLGPGFSFFVETLDVLRTPAGPSLLAGITCAPLLRCFGQAGLHRLDDGGAWEPTGVSGSISGVAVSRMDRAAAFVSKRFCRAPPNISCELHSTYSTDDGGLTWDLRSLDPVDIRAVDPYDKSIVFADGPTGLLKSVDGGRSWQDTGVFGPIGPVVMTTAGSPILYAVILDWGNDSLLRSLDSGASWDLLGAGPPSGILCLEVDPKDEDALLIGTRGAGVYRSGDRGVSWYPFNRGIETLPINDLEFDATGTILYAATVDGVYSLETPAPRLVSPR